MTRSWRLLASIALFGFLAGGTVVAADAGNVDLPRYPSISPDGEQIVFSWRGDLWKVAASGGEAVRITSHPGDEARSAWSRDGRWIAFNSNRNGSTGIYRMSPDGTGVVAVTDSDRGCILSDYGVAGSGREFILFSGGLEGDVYRSGRPYRVDPEGGDLLRVHDGFGAHPVADRGGTRIVFTRGGAGWARRGYRGPDARDVWMWEATDGSFTRLTEWEGNDGQARWEDNETLLFLSDRELDRVNVYRMELASGKVSRLTDFKDRDVEHLDVAADGPRAVLMAWDTLYTLELDGSRGGAREIPLRGVEDERDRFEMKKVDREVTEAALSPDGKVMAFVAYGEIHVRNLEEKSPTRRVTDSHAREHGIAWSPDGLELFFVSDRDGTESIFSATVARTRQEVKDAFHERLNPPEEEAEEETGDDGGEEAGEDDNAPEENGEGDDEEDDAAADDADEDTDQEDDLPPELDPSRWHDARTFRIEPMIQEDTNDRDPSPSPDGESLAFRRGLGNLVILDRESGRTRTLVGGWDSGLHWRWSPDSRHLAYAMTDLNFNRDIWIVDREGEEAAVNITRHPDNDMSPRWSADGRILTLISERVAEEYDVWKVYLDPALEAYTPKELEDYYKDAVEAAKKREPLKVERPGEGDGAEGEGKHKNKGKKPSTDDPEPIELSLDDAYLRLQRVTTLSGSEFDNELTPGGDRFIFSAVVGEERALYSLNWDGKKRQKLAGEVDVMGLSLTGDKVVVVGKGRAGTVPPDKEKLEHVDIDAEIRLDLQEQSSQKFLEAARTLGELFYHPTMKGLDWEALTERYHELARSARTASEFNSVASRFIGELNASHLGIRAPAEPTPNARAQGRLGTVHTRVEDGFEVLEVIPETPAAVGPMALEVGDVILAAEGTPFGPRETLESRLRGRVDEETLLTVRRVHDGTPLELDVLITPISYRAEVTHRYNRWRRENARKAEEWSDGRLGYIHIRAMNQSSLDVFERDLYAAAAGKDGLLIDVRNNGGGWTTDRLLGSIMTRPHAYTIPRGADPDAVGHYPQDRLFIQRYTLPINMLCNEKSFSNAEIISHAFKTLGRGTLVGQETYGAVISTGGTRLIDGTFVRLPFRGWYLLDGTDMENHGAVPDLLVPQTPEAESADADEQLQAAVEDLLERL